MVSLPCFSQVTKECMTIQPDPSTVTYWNQATNQGNAGLFVTGKLPSTDEGFFHVNAPFVDEGPKYQGAVFDFYFGSLAIGEKRTFNMYLGATSNELDAQRTIQSVGAEVYAFAKPSNDAGQCIDTPNVFIMAFKGVGGNPIQFNLPTAMPTSAPSPQPVLPPIAPTILRPTPALPPSVFMPGLPPFFAPPTRSSTIPVISPAPAGYFVTNP